jgi:hypothetical protein
MLTTCSEPGCATLVMGGRCIEHDQIQTRVFVRGRPVITARTAARAQSLPARTFATSGVARTLDVRSDTPLDLAPSRN